jgi:protein TonB
MKNECRHPQGIPKMKRFFSVSFLIHLAFFSLASILFSHLTMDPPPRVHVEVSLYPWISDEKPVKASIKKERSSPTPLRVEVSEIPVDEPPLNEPVLSEPTLSEPHPLPLEERVQEVRVKEKESVEMEPIVQTMNSARALPEDNRPMVPAHSPLNLPFTEESKSVVKSPSLSKGEIVLIHPRYVENPKPLYPGEARTKGYQGEVLLKVEILSNGRVGQMEVKKSSGHEILDRSALSAVKQWKFTPAKKGETAISAWVNIPIKFQLQ